MFPKLINASGMSGLYLSASSNSSTARPYSPRPLDSTARLYHSYAGSSRAVAPRSTPSRVVTMLTIASSQRPNS